MKTKLLPDLHIAQFSLRRFNNWKKIMQLHLQIYHSNFSKHMSLINYSKDIRKINHMTIPWLKLKKYTTPRPKFCLTIYIYKSSNTILHLGALIECIALSFMYLYTFQETLLDSGLPIVLNLISTIQRNSLISLHVFLSMISDIFCNIYSIRQGNYR